MQANFAMGVSLMKRDDESMPEYFLSFSPLAPFFGVKWRFAPAMSGAMSFDRADAADAKPEIRVKAAKAEEAVAFEVEASPASAAVERTDAPSAPELQMEPEPAGVAPAALYAEAPSEIDDLKLIKGVGPKLESELNALGLYTFAQIAALTPENLVWLDEHLSTVRGRAARDGWAAQAAELVGA